MKPLNVLIIDDNRDLADGMGMILEDEGCQVVIVYTGCDGVREFNGGKFDVVFLDVKLADMNGVEVFHAIHHKNPTTRVIMMTGYRVEQLLAEVVGDGDVEIMRKPVELDRVLDVLSQVKDESIVLLADDEPGLADRLLAYLGECGTEAVLAKNPESAVENILSSTVEVLILDLRMTITHGLNVYLELKHRGCAVTTIIVAGIENMGSDVVDILRPTAVTGCLFKPFKPDEMLCVLKQI